MEYELWQSENEEDEIHLLTDTENITKLDVTFFKKTVVDRMIKTRAIVFITIVTDESVERTVGTMRYKDGVLTVCTNNENRKWNFEFDIEKFETELLTMEILDG